MPCLPCLFPYCFAAAFCELDSLRVGQWMVSRPVVLGPFLGWLCGEPGLGALLGAAVEVFCLDLLPLGGLLPLNGAAATAAAVWLASELHAPGYALAAGLLLGWGFRWVEGGLRRLSSGFHRVDELALRAGQPAHPLRGIVAATGLHFLAFLLVLLAGLSLLEAAGPGLLALKPAAGLETAFSLVPLLGAAAFLDALRPRPR